jgi:predicted permease
LLSIVLGARLHFALKGDRKKALIILGTGALLVVLFVLFLVFAFIGLGRIDFK